MLQTGELLQNRLHGLSAVSSVSVSGYYLDAHLAQLEYHFCSLFGLVFRSLFYNHLLPDALGRTVDVAVQGGGLRGEVGADSLAGEVPLVVRSEMPCHLLCRSITGGDKPLGRKAQESGHTLARDDGVAAGLVCLCLCNQLDGGKLGSLCICLPYINAKVLFGILGIGACVEVLPNCLYLKVDDSFRKCVNKGSVGILSFQGRCRHQYGQRQSCYKKSFHHLTSIFCGSKGSWTDSCGCPAPGACNTL